MSETATTPATTPPPSDDFEDVDALLAELGPEATEVQIYQVERGGRHNYLETWEPSEFSLDAVKERWGGGRFQVRLKGPGRGYIKQRAFRIAGPSLLAPAGLPAALATGPQAAPTSSPEVTELRREVASLRELIQGQERGSRFEEMIALTRLLTERERPAVDPVDTLLKGIELAEKMGSGSSGYSEVLNRLGVPLLDFLQEQAAKEKGAPPGAPKQPAALPAGSGQPSPDIHAPAWVPSLAPWVPQLLQLAAAGRNPQLYAALIVDTLEGNPDQTPLALLRDAVGQGDAFLAEFYQHVPDALQRSEWFGELFGEIQGLLFGDDGDDTEEGDYDG